MPIYALNQVSDERCEWLVPGMLKDKVLALVKSLHQRPRSRLVPLPDYAESFAAARRRAMPASAPAACSMRCWTMCARAPSSTSSAPTSSSRRVPPHLFMNFRIVDEHGRQLGSGRNLAALKAEFGGQARSAFQALARLKTQRRTAESQQPRCGCATVTATAGASRRRPSPPPSRRRRERYTDWSFGELPELMEVRRATRRWSAFRP